MFLLAVLLLSISTASADSSICEKSSKQITYKLRDDLLCDYDPLVRPKLSHKNTTDVEIRMIVKDFKFNMHENMLTVNTWFIFKWTDDHLTWNPSDYQNIDLINIKSSDIWTPDLSIFNKHQQTSDVRLITDVECIAKYDGNVSCIPPVSIDTSCTADLTNYPYDKQLCGVNVGSWVHAGEAVNPIMDKYPIDIEEMDENPEWKLENITYIRFDGVYNCCPDETYPSIVFVFKIHRKYSFQEATILIPSFVLVVLALVALIISVNESERFILIICNVICHLIFMQYISWQLPDIGDNTPKIILFGRDSLIILTVELILTVLLRKLTKSEENSDWVTNAINTALNSKVGNAVLNVNITIKDIRKLTKEDDRVNIIEDTSLSQESKQNSIKNSFRFAQLIDRLCFIIFLILYIVMYVSLIIIV